MQKKLLALAIAGAMCAPLAAQAQSSNVQIYGQMKPSIDRVDNGQETGTSLADNNSRLGFKGSEDLGNGLKAIFQMETAINVGEGETGKFMHRDTWAGLSSKSLGTVVFGKKFTAYKSSTNFVDPFGDTIGDYNNIFGVYESGSDGFNDRATNGVNYKSPSFGGFQVEATYGMGDAEDGHESKGGDTIRSVAATYKVGSLTLVAAYEDQQRNRLGGTDNAKAYKAAVGYKIGTTQLALAYAKEDFGDDVALKSFGVQGVNAADISSKDRDRDLVYASVKHSMGNIDLLAAYTWADDLDGVKKSGVDAFALGAQYNFSKRTRIGAYYALVDNDSNAGYGLDSGYDPSDNGEKVKAFSVQMVHKF